MRSLAIMLVTTFFASSLHATEARPTPDELALLPPYCLAKQQGTPAEKQMWEQSLGKAPFRVIHHYCNGLNFLNRYQRDARQSHLRRAVKEFDFVLRHWSPQFTLYADAHAKRGLASSLAGLQETPATELAPRLAEPTGAR